jgi:hypothetical protein
MNGFLVVNERGVSHDRVGKQARITGHRVSGGHRGIYHNFVNVRTMAGTNSSKAQSVIGIDGACCSRLAKACGLRNSSCATIIGRKCYSKAGMAGTPSRITGSMSGSLRTRGPFRLDHDYLDLGDRDLMLGTA